MDVNAPLRVCPAFKIYWVENNKIRTIKRYDHDKPYIIPQEIFHLVRRVYQDFKFEEHYVKFKDEEGELVDLTVTDNVSFQFDKGFTQFYIYVFTSKEDAAKFVPPCTGNGAPVPNSALRPTRDPDGGSSETPASTSTTVTAATNAATNAATSPNLPTSGALPIDNSIEAAYKLVLTSALGSYHKNINCDGCLGDVPTNRYQCLQCPKFNLCAKCEAKGVHPEHVMVRISQSFVRGHRHNLHDALHEIYCNAAKRKRGTRWSAPDNRT